MEQNKRLYGLDLLRILAMLLITAIHFVAYSGVFQMPELTNYNRWILSAVSGLFVAAVNLFFLITGYFSCEKSLNIKRVFSLWVQVFLLGIVLTVVGVLVLERPFGIVSLLKTVFPFSTMHYWFFTMYVLLMLFSPWLNLFMNKITERAHKGICIAGFVVFCVFFVSNPFIDAQYYIADARGFLWISYIYFVGAGFKKYGWNMKPRNKTLAFLVVYSLLILLHYFDAGSIGNSQLVDGNSVLPFLLSLLLFLTFKDANVKGKIVRSVLSKLSACSFLVYVLQEHDLIRAWYWEGFHAATYAASPWLILNLIVSLLALWPIALLLQWVFDLLRPFVNYLYEKLMTVFQALAQKGFKRKE